MNEPVYILGGGRTDFKRNLKKEGKTIRDLITEAGRKAIEDAKIDPGEIQAARGWKFQRRAVHQTTASRRVHSGDRSEIARHPDDAHRSGVRFRRAVRVARRAMDHGRISRRGARRRRGTAEDDVVARRRRMCSARRPIITSKSRNTAISCSRNYSGGSRRFTSRNTARPKRDLAWVACKNYAHAKLNPLAQMRDADLTYDCASQVSDKNPSVAPPLKVSDCSQITDGAAALVLVSGKVSGQERPR